MSGARVPFALVGVLLLVSSATFAGSQVRPAATEPAVDDAMDRTSAEVSSALREAVATAAVEAARDPVTRRARTPFGTVLNRTETFRDALRIRIYHETRDRLRRISGRRDGLAVTASLPPTPTPAALERAKRRVSVTSRDSGTALRVTLRTVSLTASRDGRTVGRTVLSPTVSLPVPVLAVHDRVRAFERRLNAGPARPGLGRRLTARLSALAWARGYAQFGGAPIANVIANRHVGLVTNGAVLGLQRGHFGASDPRGRSMLAVATAHTGLTDVLDGAGHPVTDALSATHDRAGLDRTPADILSEFEADGPTVRPSDSISFALGNRADRAFLDTVSAIERPIAATYRVTTERRVTVEKGHTRHTETPTPPEPGWQLESVDRTTSTTASPGSAPSPSVDGPWHTIAHHARSVNATTTTRRTWSTGNGTETTVGRRRTRYSVSVALVGRHDGGEAPLRPFDSVHERGGPLHGPNLAGIGERAADRLLPPGGVDAIARRAVARGGGTANATIVGDRPDGIESWIREDLDALRERVRNVSVTTKRGDVATLRTNPPARLLTRLRDRWDGLLDAPSTYAGVADRARTEARRAYLERVATRLETHADRYRDGRRRLRDRLRARGVESLEHPRPEPEPSRSGSAVPMRVRATPAYLTLGALQGGDLPRFATDRRIHPLVARNVNLVTVPYGSLADGVVDAIMGPDRVDIGTAAGVLRTATRVENSTGTDPIDTTRLRAAVSDATGHLADRAVTALGGAGVGTPDGRRTVVRRALGRWDSVGARGMALANGSAAAAIDDRARSRWSLSASRHDRIALRVERAIARGRSETGARPPQPAVDDGVRRLRRLVSAELSRRAGDVARRGTVRTVEALARRSISDLPAGLPFAPLPTAWYATVNAWRVQVRGRYSRFAVRVPYGTPDRPGASLRYVRDGAPVSLDVDEDGTRERLGRAERVSFRTNATTAVAVPPGIRGVGDKDGLRDERSAGWPLPGPR